MEVEWGAGNFKEYPLHADGSPRFVLSQGDTTGYGWHIDFMNGGLHRLCCLRRSDIQCG